MLFICLIIQSIREKFVYSDSKISFWYNVYTYKYTSILHTFGILKSYKYIFFSWFEHQIFKGITYILLHCYAEKNTFEFIMHRSRRSEFQSQKYSSTVALEMFVMYRIVWNILAIYISTLLYYLLTGIQCYSVCIICDYISYTIHICVQVNCNMIY